MPRSNSVSQYDHVTCSNIFSTRHDKDTGGKQIVTQCLDKQEFVLKGGNDSVVDKGESRIRIEEREAFAFFLLIGWRGRQFFPILV
mmetsp:Transcript_23379/g.47258  ORF Transcript_23379/g.47258 Transcript_23379/m.47258 type:complete len:86 (-) Transcript_23379:762-1019(-)